MGTERDSDVDTDGGKNDETEEEELMNAKVTIVILVFTTAVRLLLHQPTGHNYPSS